MRKMLLIPLIVCMVALLSTLSTPVHATPPPRYQPQCIPRPQCVPAEGTWNYTPRIIEMWDWGFLGDEVANWTGTFNGTSYDVFTVVFHDWGWSAIGLIFFDGTVTLEDDTVKEGSLVILFVGKKPEGQDWHGHWVILSGKGDLANLRGRGTWWGPGAPEPGVEGPLDYSGWIHFKPIRKWRCHA